MKSPVARLRRYARKNGLTLTLRALNLAEHCHKDDKRDDETAFINHPVAATLILILLDIINDVILAAEVLHDIVEKRKATLEELEIEFCQEVALLVDLVSQRIGESLDDYYERISKDIRAILVKAADNLHNMSNMIGIFPADRMEFNMGKSENYVLPMIKKAQIVYPEYRDILSEFEHRITAKLDEAKAYLTKVHARDRLIDALSGAEMARAEDVSPTPDSERREA